MPDDTRGLGPRIIVLGVGGAGGNAVNNMIASDLTGVEFVVANTDAQALAVSRAQTRIQMGSAITEGLGAGARPEVGKQAAEDSADALRAAIDGAHMLFITAGMGGGTGTGAAPVIAREAAAAGVLSVAVVTKPFVFEGSTRRRLADEGLAELAQYVDMLIVIPNQNLYRVVDPRTPLDEAFRAADEVLHSGVRGITDLMTRPGLVNLDFADVRTVVNVRGKAVIGAAEASGEGRAKEAARAAIDNPLLDDATVEGAKAVLLNITGSGDLSLMDIEEAANEVRAEVDEEAHIIVGSARDDALGDRVRVSLVATGIQASGASRPANDRLEQSAASGTTAASEPASEQEQPLTAADRTPGVRDRRSASPFRIFNRRSREEPGARTVTHEAPAEPESVTPTQVRREPAPAAPAPAAAQGPVDETDLEIPAFLRRQTR